MINIGLVTGWKKPVGLQFVRFIWLSIFGQDFIIFNDFDSPFLAE